MDIKKKFLELTSRTYPHGTEQSLRPMLPSILNEDEHGNLFVKIGESKCMFTSHLDTACREQSEVKHIIKGNFIKTDGKTILGADDKAGVTVMLYMIDRGVPGLYYFFLGEERGCIGSGKAAKTQREKPLTIEKVISFDRRGTDSIITHQSGLRCCSDEFAQALSNELNRLNTGFKYKKDNTGILTDSLEFIELYSECTNISVGYYSEHTTEEQQDIEHLKKLCTACADIKWDELPTKRKPSTQHRHEDFEIDYQPIRNKRNESWSTDTHGNKCHFVTDESGNVLKATLNDERKQIEHALIDDFLKSIQLEIKTYTWDGARLTVKYHDGHKSTCRRAELYPYIHGMDHREW